MDDIKNLLRDNFSQSGQNKEVDKRADFDAQLVASLMIQSNAFISIKTAAKLCSISRQTIDRRIHDGTFPIPEKLSSEDNAIRKAFRIKDIQQWLNSPLTYRSPQ